MTPEEKDLLQEVLELTKDNNKMLHSMRRSMRLGRFMSLFYWIVILGSAFGAYYFVQPYLEMVGGVYSDTKSTLDASAGDVGGILDTIRKFTQ